jgi:hypothetical protein
MKNKGNRTPSTLNQKHTQILNQGFTGGVLLKMGKIKTKFLTFIHTKNQKESGDKS